MLTKLLLAFGLVLMAGAGAFAATALTASNQQATTTTTISITQGPTGPTGPAGPTGPQGPQGDAGLACPTGYVEGDLVINHPGGQVTLFTCLKQ